MLADIVIDGDVITVLVVIALVLAIIYLFRRA